MSLGMPEERTWNDRSVGVEISNAYYTKYQSWYEKRDFGPRPIITDARSWQKTTRTSWILSSTNRSPKGSYESRS